MLVLVIALARNRDEQHDQPEQNQRDTDAFIGEELRRAQRAIQQKEQKHHDAAGEKQKSKTALGAAGDALPVALPERVIGDAQLELAGELDDTAERVELAAAHLALADVGLVLQTLLLRELVVDEAHAVGLVACALHLSHLPFRRARGNSFALELFDGPAQRLARIVEARHDGADRDVENVRDLLVRVVLEILEHDDLPMIFRQAIQRSAYEAFAFVLLEVFERRGGRTGNLTMLVLVIDRHVVAPAGDEIEAVVLDDAIEPGIERPRFIETGARLVRLDERFLRKVAR